MPKASVARPDERRGRLGVGRVAHVGGARHRAGSSVGDRAQWFGVEVAEDDRGALGSEPKGGGATDPASGAGDDGDRPPAESAGGATLTRHRTGD